MMYRHKGKNYTCDYTYTYTLYLLLFLLHSAYRISCRPNFDGFSRTMLKVEQACSLFKTRLYHEESNNAANAMFFARDICTANRRNMILKIAHNDSYHWLCLVPSRTRSHPSVTIRCASLSPEISTNIFVTNSLYRHTT